MGCGSSSLKGEKVDGLDGAGPPARKVQTNFSEVNFASGAGPDRRGTMAVAPDEHHRAHKISEEAAAPKSPTKSRNSAERAAPAEGVPLEPYKSIDGPEGVNKKMDVQPALQTGGITSNEEAAALANAGSASANPIKV